MRNNGGLDTHLRYHLTRELERLYQPAGQSEYTPSA